MRSKLLHLHKVLLDDARVAYELDRGRVGSVGHLLQLVINDPWFAWLHALSGLIVRIDEGVEPEAAATMADANALVDQVERLLTASEDGRRFSRRYFEALQRQPAVVLAHADVRRALKAMRAMPGHARLNLISSICSCPPRLHRPLHRLPLKRHRIDAGHDSRRACRAAAAPPGTSAARKLDRSLVEGPIAPAVWKMAWPTVLQNAIGGLQGIIDHAMVGHYVGFTGNAAIGVSWQIFLVVIVFIASLFTGMGVLVARFAGANEPDKVNRTVYQAFLTAVVLALGVLAPLGYVLSPTLLDLVNATPEVQAPRRCRSCGRCSSSASACCCSSCWAARCDRPVMRARRCASAS